jgi:hypothetical protein
MRRRARAKEDLCNRRDTMETLSDGRPIRSFEDREEI